MSPRLALALPALVALAALSGCNWAPWPRWGKGATHHDSDQAKRQLVADGQAGVQFEPPADDPPPLAEAYRFAPGDRLDLRLYGHPEYDQPDSVIDPDGFVHFNVARDIPAAGKTVAELRAEIEKRVVIFVKEPRAIVQPRLVVGHRFYLLGSVAHSGAYPLDRPLRVLDAIARAGGIETGLQDNTTVELADFDKSVLVREGKYVPIDFQALIQHGDLRYNVHVHPGDLLFFPSTIASEVYVLGAVRVQGAQPFAQDLTMISLLTQRGGLLERAYRRQIAVLRGNLSQPRIYLFDIDDVLSARAKDFRIQAGDVVYVPDRPFEYLRELALSAAQAFVGVIGSRAGNQTADHILPAR